MATTSSAAVTTENTHSNRKPTYTRAEVALHNKPDDLWIIIYGRVYNVTKWAYKHPGGKEIMQNYGGEDASLAFESFHNNKKFVRGHMAKLYIGDIVEEERELSEMCKDFLRLREDMIQKGFFKVNPWYYIIFFTHIVLIEVLGVLILWHYGTGWWQLLLSGICIATSQTQAGFLQHDIGHRSVANSTRVNRFFHDVVFNFFKGGCCNWWNYRHYKHHAKPNVYKKDPDITLAYLYVLGKNIPVQMAKKGLGFLPYNQQHKYFFLTMPPLLFPVFFHYDIMNYLIRNKDWWDALWMTTFFIRWYYCIQTLFGFWGSFLFYFFARFLESHWFTWVTQMNHIPMEIDFDKRREWPELQTAGTCNVESSWFLDWFTGHLNFQIEHHFFPTMPSHNFYKAQPYVQEFCEKHGLEYVQKPIYTAFADIVRSMKDSGEIWLEAKKEKHQ